MNKLHNYQGIANYSRSIKTKLMAFSIVLIVVTAAATLGPALYLFDRYNDEVANRQAQTGVNGLNLVLEEYKNKALDFGAVFAGEPGVSKAVQTKDAAAIVRELTPLLQQAHIDFATVTDAQGVVIARTHEAQRGDSVATQANVRAALSGKPAAFVEPGTVVKLSVRAGIPVKNDQGGIAGVISLGYYLDRPEIVDAIKNQYETDITLFLGDTRLNTTVINNGERAVGTKLSPDIADKVLKQGQTYAGRAEILGQAYITYYKPLPGPDERPVGVLFAGKSMTEAVAARDKVAWTSGLIAAAVMLLVIFAASFAASQITRPIKQMVSAMVRVAAGDLTQSVHVETKDELGLLAEGFNKMIEELKGLIKQVNSSAETLASASGILTVNGEQSAQAASHVADTIANVAHNTLQQSTAVAHTSTVIAGMAEGMQLVAANAEEVAGLAEKSAAAANDGERSIQRAVTQMDTIEATVTHSAQVVADLGKRSQEIDTIVGMIAGIAAQTNLLALNAAIEAARAGEQGRGFAVVAEEVRKLAEQSTQSTKQIAGLIGGIQQDTVNAVNAMTSGSAEVRTGLTLVAEAGRTFSDIAALIGQVLAQAQKISSAIGGLADSSQSIVSSVRDIETSSQSIAGQTETVSAATEQQLASMQEIAASSQALVKLAEELHQNVNKFKA